MYIFLLLIIILTINLSYYLLLDRIIGLLDSHNENSLLNFIEFESNFLPLLLFFSWFFIAKVFLRNKYFSIVSSLVILTISIILLCDNCVFNLLGTRLNFTMTGYATEFEYFSDFLKKYLYSDSAQFMVVGFVFSIILLCYSFSKSIHITKYFFGIYSILVFISCCWGCLPVDINKVNFEFFNPFQVNGFAFQRYGNFSKQYSVNYELREKLNITWTENKGLNGNKNVILILVESFGCNITSICGNSEPYMPNIEQIAKENLLFTNYYSIYPSTSMSTLSIIKSVPVIQNAWNNSTNSTNSINYAKKLYETNDLISAFRRNNYFTSFISSTNLVFSMGSIMEMTNFDEIIDAKSEEFKNVTNRYVFNSVNDEDMFDAILEKVKIQTNRGKFLFVTKTASNHSPYNSPYGNNDIKKSFLFTDYSVNKFIKQLENINYFNNGIVVIVGDHHPWGNDNPIPTEELQLLGETYINKVPLIIVDGKHRGSVNEFEFSHASLGVLLQYLELPTYTKNQFNVNPFIDSEYETIYGYEYGKMSFIYVKKDKKIGTILLDGDNTEFIINNGFTTEEQENILGYISYFRR